MKKIMENEAFLKGLVDVESPETLAKLFAENKIELEEGTSIEEAFETVKRIQNGELIY